MLKIIQEWLAKPSGRYFDGLAIFTQLASADIKKKYLEYFGQVKEEPKQHDIHFTMLINKVSAIAQNVQVNPALFENIELVLKETDPDTDTQKAIEEKTAEIEALKKAIELFKSENTEILDENSELSDQVEELESDLETAQGEVSEYEVKLEELEKELTALKAKRGIQIMAIKDMPEDLQKGYARNKEITPLMASIHSQISVEGLDPSTRKKLVKQLCDLDDERRANWDAINDWSEGKTVETAIEVKEELSYDSDPLVAGAQMLRRVDRLTENIKRSQDVADATDKETIKANALKRIEAYNVELEELKAKLTPAQPEGSAVE
jgi:DNA repair exonuclease SbcCD ATPase subunit